MARLRPSSPFAPALAYTGDRERLEAERAEILSKLRRVPERSPFRPALHRSLTRVTAQLVAISHGTRAHPRFEPKGSAMKPPIPSVSDRAVLRYLERAQGVDIEAIRSHIRTLVTNAVARQGSAVIIEGVKFVLTENVVITVIDRRWPATKAPPHGREPRDA